MSYARTMYAKVLSYCAVPRGTMDRGTLKLDELISRIKNSQYDPEISFDDAICGAKGVNPSRVSLPERAGILDPRDHLSGKQLREFNDMPHSIPETCRSSKDGPACHKVDPKDWPVLLKKLYQADMITFLPKSEVLAEGRRLIKGGLFCVPHKPESDRLINDRRPLNLREKRLGWCQLPAGHMLTQLILNRDESIRASGDDLQNYFYLIKHLESWHHRNAFGQPFKGKLLPELGLEPSQWYVPAFKVVCMGDTNGVDLAQATHESLLRYAGCLDPSQTLVYGKIFPSSATLEGLYIDDHLTFQVSKKKPFRGREPLGDEVLMQRSREAYERWKLPRSKKKAFDKHYTFKAWGTHVDSASGMVSAPREKLRQIETLTTMLLEQGRATKKAMQKLIGLYVHPFLHRRECMCIFHHVYAFVDKMPEAVLVTLPQHVRDELLTASLPFPLVGSNARWPISIQVSATDASSKRGGRAACLSTKSFVKTLYRFGEKRGEYTRLDWDMHSIQPPTSMTRTPEPLVDSLLRHHWVATQSCGFSKKDHINILELEMVRQEIRDRVSAGRGRCRVVNLCDSRVTVGAFAKGRSSSRQMNHKLRACLPWLLGGDLSLTNIWVPTDANPADHPSRGNSIPPPDPHTPDPLLAPEILKGVQVYRSPGVQSFLEQDSQQRDSEPVLECHDVPELQSCPVVTNKSERAQNDKSVEPEASPKASEMHDPVKWTFREIFAGKARLSQACGRLQHVSVGEAFDYKNRGSNGVPQDILNNRSYRRLRSEASLPNQAWHFGLPCGSFSILQHSNHGTRRKGIPQGDGSLLREVIGNKILNRTLKLISILEKAGNYWTLENPRSSYVWLMPGIAEKLENPNYREAIMHQCAYGLRLKGTDGTYGPCKKHTRFFGNLPGLETLEKYCKCRQPHVHAVGGVRTSRGWMRRSELAGHYPQALCVKYAALIQALGIAD